MIVSRYFEFTYRQNKYLHITRYFSLKIEITTDYLSPPSPVFPWTICDRDMAKIFIRLHIRKSLTQPKKKKKKSPKHSHYLNTNIY